MNILEKIVLRKSEEITERKRTSSLESLKDHPYYYRSAYSLVNSLQGDNSSGIIAEFKRRSPSKGIINDKVDPVVVTSAYQDAGAAAVSILTDTDFFGGSSEDVTRSREALSIPILRKEFIVDPYQIHEARHMGADLILLIAACLSASQVQDLSAEARSIGLEVLLELHDEDELVHICETVDLVGINNRSLKTFDVDIERSLRMASAIPEGKPKVAESGIDDPEQVKMFRKNGYKGFLIGENFMKNVDPGNALKQFISNI
jgi:indole-3-glycerol phosphate synthase